MRTNADKRRAVEIALKEFPKLSSREIAKICAVSDPFVLKMKPEQVLTVSTSKTVTGADGKSYPATKPARAQAVDAPAVEPNKPAPREIVVAGGHGHRPHVAGLRELADDYLSNPEELAEFHAEAIGLYRALLAQAPQLVA